MEPRDARLHAHLASALRHVVPAAHPSADVLAAHALSELDAGTSLAVTRHLAACADGGCSGVVREALGGAALARAALYPDASETPERAHLVHFKDDVWEAFEALAREEQCSVDWLLGEAIKAYALARSRPAVPRDVSVTEAEPASSPFARERNTPTMQRSFMPRAPASSRRPLSPEPPPVASPRRLVVVHQGVRYDVAKPLFVVGRGQPASDLAIDDPGVSRQHAVIERDGARYFLVDLGSTNGVEFDGARISRKEIEDGDRVRICDHELAFFFG